MSVRLGLSNQVIMYKIHMYEGSRERENENEITFHSIQAYVQKHTASIGFRKTRAASDEHLSFA